MDEKVPSQDFPSFIQENVRTVAEGIKTSGILPVGSARNNFNTCFPSFSSKMKPFSNEVLNIVSTLLTREGIKEDVKTCGDEEKIDLVVDGVNKILDRVRGNLNILNGIKSVPVPVESTGLSRSTGVGSWNKDHNRSVVWKANHVQPVKKPSHTQKLMEKPQSKFTKKVDNTNSPFEPSLHSKPNAVKPLCIYLERDVNGIDSYCHPYMHELNVFRVPQNQLHEIEPVKPVDILPGSFCYVDNEDSLRSMIQELKNVEELAIDLEYHHYRSFHGFTCLLQISSRTKDYVIDTILLRDELQALNEFFTNPKIVKVLHGATNDVIWLQKDLNLYLVNMFDTYLASTLLNFPRLNLAYLLKRYCDVDTDKSYQLFDWRIRPLPEAALSYARCDTHYLLYIYDRLRNELIESASGKDNLLLSVYSRSTELCKTRYEKTSDENGHLMLHKESKQSFDGRQMHALKLLYQWRDRIAREQDESTKYVLPNHMLIQIAEILPREMQGILACCNPVPVLVRQNLSHLHQLITLARSQPANKIPGRDDVELTSVNQQPSLSKLKCPHDFSYHDDFRDNLKTLLAGSDTIFLDDEVSSLKLSVLDESAVNNAFYQVKNETGAPVALKSVYFISPYERYKRTLKFERAQTKEANHSIQNQPKEVPTELEENVHIFSSRSSHKKEDSETVKETENIDSSVSHEISSSAPSDSTKSSDSVGRKRKQKIILDQIVDKKCAKYDNIILPSISKSSQIDNQDSDELKLENEPEKITNSSPVATIKKKKEKMKRNLSDSTCSNEATSVDSSFKPFDYTKANFNKFASVEQKNLKTLLSSKIRFGSNKKDIFGHSSFYTGPWV